MQNRLPRKVQAFLLPAVFLLITAALVFGGQSLLGSSAAWAAGSLVVGGGLAAGLFWLLRERHQLALAMAVERESARHAQARLNEVVRESAESGRRLEMVLNFNRRLVQAQDEQTLMDSALGMVNELTGALGCSFVPVDEWEQPLPAFTSGNLPEPVLRAWAEHLSGSMLRERCGTCQVLHSTPGGCPLHPPVLGDSLKVYCLPLMGRDVPVNGEGHAPRKLGVLNLYVPAGRDLDGETQIFLEGMLQEIALLVEAARLRQQEMTTLRQIRMLHAPEASLQESLSGLLEGLRQALDVDFVHLRLRPSTDGQLSGLDLRVGSDELPPEADIEPIFASVLRGEVERSELDQAPMWLALPMRLPEGQVPGMLLVGSRALKGLHARQEAILQTVAAQAALLVENDRMLRSLEYKAVIQERNRLAREIHDGLAQTLAYLKLQAAQMQTYLDKGDLSRLSQVLKDNYTALADAYLDTRQAIDNLRLTPREGLEGWLEHTIADFEASHSIHTERRLQAISPAWNPVLSPEVQAQMIRIVQEALNNVRKHARATSVTISLFEWQGDLVLEIRDDGRGFAPEDVPEISQHGLRGIRERAELIGADFQIISQSHQGTAVRLVLPAYLKESAR